MLGQAAGVAGPGIAAGVVAAWALAGLLGPFTFGVDPRSPAVLVAVAAGTALVVALAVAAPARRAMATGARQVLTGAG